MTPFTHPPLAATELACELRMAHDDSSKRKAEMIPYLAFTRFSYIAPHSGLHGSTLVQATLSDPPNEGREL